MTIYFRNLENISITGKEGNLIKRKIAYALEKDIRGWITIYNQDEVVTESSIPDLVINLDDIIAVR